MSTETLRPTANGDKIEIPSQNPDSGSHYDKVDDVSPDDAATYIYVLSSSTTSWVRDLFQLSDLTSDNVIESIKIYFRARETGGTGNARPCLKIDSSEYEGTIIQLTTSWATYSQTYSTNPKTGEAWTKDEVNSLQVGVDLRIVATDLPYASDCTQVYVVVTIIDPPAPPTNVQASDGIYFDKVHLTWTKASGAVDYQFYRDGEALGWLGDVDEYEDEGADAPVITPGTASATRGRKHKSVRIKHLAGISIADGTVHTYKLRSKDSYGQESGDSDTDTGYRLAPPGWEYQWQRSAADSDADYSDLSGFTRSSHYDYNAPAYPAGRYWRCKISSYSCDDKYTPGVRGYRRNPSLAPVEPSVDIIIKDPDSDVLAYTTMASGLYTEKEINHLGVLKFTVPSDSQAAEYLEYPNEAWLYIDGDLEQIYKITGREVEG